jgi:hypothetical protein
MIRLSVKLKNLAAPKEPQSRFAPTTPVRWPPSIISRLPRNWLHRRWATLSSVTDLVLGETSSTGDGVGRLACPSWNRPVPDGEVVAGQWLTKGPCSFLFEAEAISY